MSPPASPVPTAAPANPAGPAESQTPAAGSNESGNADSTPFAAVLGNQMKGTAKQDDGNTEPAIKTILSLTDQDQALPPADTLALIASMLAGVAPPPTAKENAVRAGPVDVNAGQETEPDAIPVDAVGTDSSAILAAPVMTGNTATLAPSATPGNGEEARADVIASPRDTRTPADQAAIVAAAATAKAETASETGVSKSEAGKFDALLDAAARGQSAAASNAGGHAAQAAGSRSGEHGAAERVISVATPFGTPGWNREVGEKLTWMVGRQQTNADIVLNPPQMGRIEVSLSISGDQATATFVSANPVVREALENAIPQLRETLQGAGISLGQTQVGAESFQQAANQRENGDNRRGGNAEDGLAAGTAASGETTPAGWLRRGNGLVDTFA